MLSKIILASKSRVRKEILDKNKILNNIEQTNVDENIIKELNNAQCPFHEPGIDALLDKHLNKTKLLSFSHSLSRSINHANIIFITF